MKLKSIAAFTTIVVAQGAGVAHADLALYGRVASGDVAIAGAKITIFAAGGQGTHKLAEGKTNSVGNFRLDYPAPKPKELVYAVAEGGSTGEADPNEAIRLLTVVSGPPRFAQINELTTVAGAYALAQFLDGKKAAGSAPGLPNAGATFFNLATPEGKPAPVIGLPPNGTKTEALATLNSLAGIISTCVRVAADCAPLFAAATPPGGSKPNNTLSAAQAIALNPGADPAALFGLLPPNSPYKPVLASAPTAWTIALKYTGGGFDGPGAMAFDADAKIWVTNNFMPPATTASNRLTVLDPVGKPIFGSPITSGGLDGTGWGVAIADKGKVWVGNYSGGSMSQFNKLGAPMTEDAFAKKQLSKTQGVTVDFDNNVWAASNGNSQVVRFRDGDRDKIKVITAGGIEKPFAISVDGNGHIWVANAGKSGSVTKLNAKGEAFAGSPFPLADKSSPKGIATDRAGNVWVADFLGDGVWILDNDGNQIAGPISVPSMDGAWGIALDGDENAWVAGFLLKRVTKLCGRHTDTCPPGSKMGDVISPPSGFQSEAFQHLTGINVDPSGNLWVANNWKTLDPIAGGDGLVAIIGIAAPVKTPLVGPPQRP
jgi:streptogramin lyase